MAGIGAALAAVGLSGGFSGGSYSSGGETIKSSAGNMGGSSGYSNNQNDRPIEIKIDNRFDVGGRGAAQIGTTTAISGTPKDK